jgi:hypothetical protein
MCDAQPTERRVAFLHVYVNLPIRSMAHSSSSSSSRPVRYLLAA